MGTKPQLSTCCLSKEVYLDLTSCIAKNNSVALWPEHKYKKHKNDKKLSSGLE